MEKYIIKSQYDQEGDQFFWIENSKGSYLSRDFFREIQFVAYKPWRLQYKDTAAAEEALRKYKLSMLSEVTEKTLEL